MIKKQNQGQEKIKGISSENAFNKTNTSSFGKNNSTNKHHYSIKYSNKENINLNGNQTEEHKNISQKAAEIINQNSSKNRINEVKKIKGLKKINQKIQEKEVHLMCNPTIIMKKEIKNEIEEEKFSKENKQYCYVAQNNQKQKVVSENSKPLSNLQAFRSFQEKVKSEPHNDVILSGLNLHCNEILSDNFKENEVQRKIIKKIIPVHSLNVSAINNSVLSNSDLSILNEINPYKNQPILPQTSKEGGTKMLFRRSKSPSNGISGNSSTLISFPRKENFMKSATEGRLLDLRSVQTRLSEDKADNEFIIQNNHYNNLDAPNSNNLNLENQVNEYAQRLEKINKKYEKLFGKLKNEKTEAMKFKIKAILGNSSFIKLEPKEKSEEMLNIIILIMNEYKNTKELLKEQNRLEKNDLLSSYKEMKSKAISNNL